MSKDNIYQSKRPTENTTDALTELLTDYFEQKINGKQAVIRNCYLPKRTVKTRLGDVEVRAPKIKDKSGQGIKFNS
jgi:DNA invertase Pin-like site-specific DNA recombinase